MERAEITHPASTMRLAIHRFLGWPTSPPRDHPPGVPVSRREQLYDLALYPAKHDKGTKYPCTEAQLRSLTHLNYEVDRPGDFDNAEKAARKLRDHLHLERRRTNGEKRALYTLKEGLELEDWGPDIALKAFHDLDLFFFFGALANNVKLRWVGKTEMKKINDTENPEGGIFVGLTVLKGSGKATIYLNRELFDVRAKVEDAMWSTLLHEMLVS